MLMLNESSLVVCLWHVASHHLETMKRTSGDPKPQVAVEVCIYRFAKYGPAAAQYNLHCRSVKADGASRRYRRNLGLQPGTSRGSALQRYGGQQRLDPGGQAGTHQPFVLPVGSARAPGICRSRQQISSP